MATEIQNVNEVVFCEKETASITVIEEADEGIICALPVSQPVNIPISETQMFKEFACQYPTVDPNVVRVSQPLPFPEKLQDVIAWTDAFVDRIASMTLSQDKMHELNVAELNRIGAENEKLRRMLETAVVDLDKSREETCKANEKVESIKKEALLAAAKAKSALNAQIQKTVDAEKRATKETERANRNQREANRLSDQLNKLRNEYNSLKQKLSEVSDAACEALKQWEEEHKEHEEDHVTLDKLRVELAEEIEKSKALQTQLLEALASLEVAKIDLDTKEALILAFTATIGDLHVEIDQANQRIAELNQKLANAAGNLSDKEAQLTTANEAITDLTTERDAALGKFAQLDEELKVAYGKIATLTVTIDALTLERDTESAAKADAEDKLEKETKAAVELATKLSNAISEITTINITLNSTNKRFEDVKAGFRQAQIEKKAADEQARQAEMALQKQKDTEQIELDALRALAEVDLEGVKTLQAQVNELKNQLLASEKRILPVSNPGKRVNIISVEYGGRAYENNQRVLEKLYEIAEREDCFQIDNGLFEGDPWHGVQKTASITYQLAAGGAARHIVAAEGRQARFE